MKKIAIILAGGEGKRVTSSTLPKQFIKIKNKLVLFYALETFYKHHDIDNIVLVTNDKYTNLMKKLIHDLGMNNKIFVISGGSSRNQSLLKAVTYMKNDLNIQDDDIILSHDAVRIFVTNKIIEDNISILEEDKADVVFTAVKSPDTICFSNNRDIVFNIPNRDYCYKGQTPQSAKWKVFKEVYNTTFDPKLFDNSDFCKLAETIGKRIMISSGNEMNFKITTDYDLMVAKKIIEG